MTKIKVGVNGLGTIGKRVASAILLQPDMELVGVTAHSNNYRVQVCNLVNKVPIYTYALRSRNEEFEDTYHQQIEQAMSRMQAMLDLPFGQRRIATERIIQQINTLNAHLSLTDFAEDYKKLRQSGIELQGGIDDLLERCDVIIDCTPSPFGKINKPIYSAFGVKSIYQGGEKVEVADCSFVAQANYDEAIGQNHVRVVSCNTTGLVRVLHAIHQRYKIGLATVTLIRRGTDSNDHKRGPINAIIPSVESPSHHGPDVRCVLPDFDVFSSAYVVPTTLMHVHDLQLDLLERAEPGGVISALHETRRVRVIPSSAKLVSTAGILDFARDLGQNARGDMMDICVWEQTIGMYDRHGHNKLFVKMAVHQESDVVPENIDAVRAVTSTATAEESMNLTDRTLNLNKDSVYYDFARNR